MTFAVIFKVLNTRRWRPAGAWTIQGGSTGMVVPGKMSAGFHEVMWFGCHKGLRGFGEGKIVQLHEIGESGTVKYCIMYYGDSLCSKAMLHCSH